MGPDVLASELSLARNKMGGLEVVQSCLVESCWYFISLYYTYPKNRGIATQGGLEIPEPCCTEPNTSTVGSNISGYYDSIVS